MTRRLITLGLSLTLAGAAFGQDSAPLSGPTISESTTAPTLIARDYNGNLRPLERRPEIAALDLLGLTEDELAGAQTVIDERAALVESMVFQNLLLLTQIGAELDAAPEGSGFEVLDAELRERADAALAPLWTGVPLMMRIQTELPAEHRAEYRRIVNAWYGAAMVEERERLPSADATPFELVVRRVIGKEVDAAYQRGQAGRDEAYEEFLDRLDLDPAIEGAVRAVALDAYLEIFNVTGREPNQAEEAQIFQKMLAVIPEDDHPRVWRAVFQMSQPESE